GLPKLSGMDLLRRVRASGKNVPILILTARDAVEDRVAGLDTGADDYLTKPFELTELQARLRALKGCAVASGFVPRCPIAQPPALKIWCSVILRQNDQTSSGWRILHMFPHGMDGCMLLSLLMPMQNGLSAGVPPAA